MDHPRTHAPADHFSPQRATLAKLTTHLVALRATLPPMRRMAGGVHHGLVSAVAALIAYLPTDALGLKESFWSAITAVAVVQTEFRATQSTARDQFIGATIGGVTALGVWFAFGQSVFAYAAAIVIAMAICWTVNVASASRLAGTTATIILLVPRVGSPEQMFAARLIEVGWGVTVAVLTVWLAARLPARHLLKVR